MLQKIRESKLTRRNVDEGATCVKDGGVTTFRDHSGLVVSSGVAINSHLPIEGLIDLKGNSLGGIRRVVLQIRASELDHTLGVGVRDEQGEDITCDHVLELISAQGLTLSSK